MPVYIWFQPLCYYARIYRYTIFKPDSNESVNENDQIGGDRCSVHQTAQLRGCLCFITKHIFHLSKLKIASAIPALNKEK